MKLKNKKINLRYVLFIIVLFEIESLMLKISSFFENNNLVQIFLILFNSLVLYVFLMKNRSNEDKKINLIIFISYLIRLIVLFLDIFCHIGVFSGSDTELFYNSAIGNNNLLPNYSKFLKLLIFFVGDSRLFLEYFNVLFLILSTLIIKKLLLFLSNGNYKALEKSIILFSLWPTNILLSGSLLREPLMIFLNTFSLYFFILWYKKGKILDFIFSCLIMLLSSYFHSGMLLLILGYGLFFVLYNNKTCKFDFHRNTILYLFLIIILFIGLYFIFGSYVTDYFDRISGVEDIALRRAVGSTDYLTFIDNTSSPFLLVFYTPLRIIYFFFSPMIWDCRGLGVFFTFLFSSCLYIYAFVISFKSKSHDSILKKIIIILILLFSIPYSWGTSNSGTAMRHREKILPFLVVIYCIREEK